jgi:ABC-type polysaccharide/polyol phosphate transport system ATPase subunit
MRRLRGKREWRWALKEVSVEVPPGDSLALIGANGSGKSTLLKIIGGVMDPYAGRLVTGGRLGALIEVRAGIHPDLTGRENILLAGTLLGLRRREVARKFDEIAAFAELEAAIDRQVKFYSLGMQMRLGFAVAVFLEPDILLVDEVLAVGDAQFQQRCLDRMRAVLAAGTTLIFVSHDLAALEALCARGLWLKDGVVQSHGPIGEALGGYRQWVEQAAAGAEAIERPGEVGLVSVDVSALGGELMPVTGGDVDVRIGLSSGRHRRATVCAGISQGTAAPVFVVRTDVDLEEGRTDVSCVIRRLPLPGGRFYVWVGVFDQERDLLAWQPAAMMELMGPEIGRVPRGIVRLAPVHVDVEWSAQPAGDTPPGAGTPRRGSL